MKQTISIEIEQDISEEDLEYLNTLDEKEAYKILDNVADENKKEIIGYFISEDIKLKSIKKLEVKFVRE